MRRYRNVRFGDSPKGAKLRQTIREMDKIRRDVDRAIPIVFKALQLATRWNSIYGTGGSLTSQMMNSAELIANDLAGYFDTDGYSSLEKRLEEEGYFKL